MTGSGFSGWVALASELVATWASGAVFAGHGLVQIDSDDVRHGSQPSQNIREFAEPVFVGTIAERLRQLTHLGGEPHESPFDAPLLIPLKVHLPNELLPVRQADLGRGGVGGYVCSHDLV